MKFILIYLSNNWSMVAALSAHMARSMPNFTTLFSSKNNPKPIGN